MSLGNHPYNARKNKGLSQEAGLLRNWRQQTDHLKMGDRRDLPDIRQSKRLAMLYGLSLTNWDRN